MVKEEDDAFGFGGLLARSKLQDPAHHGGWMGTPLRALIARESAGPSPSRKTLAEEFAGRRRSGACKGPGTGCSTSPRPRTDFASRKIRASANASAGAGAGAGDVPSKPVVEFWRPEQLGALLAQDREEPEPGRSFRSPSPSPGIRSSRHKGDCKSTKVVEASQELRYLFAKDWALQTSDEDDEFWDSGTLCGIASPSPRSSRRRTRKLVSSKLRHSSSSHCTPSTQHAQRTPVTVSSTRRSYSCRIVDADAPCVHISKPSLGTLLAKEEEIATAASSSGVANPEPTWSVPAGSRRPKIASLSDISTPVRPESQSQLDFLIGKILTLRATALAGARCSTSQATATAESPRVLQRQECTTIVTTATNPSTPDSHLLSTHEEPIMPSTHEESITPSTHEEPVTPSTPDSPSLSTHEEPFTLSDAALRDAGDEPVEVAVVSTELEALVPERVQLGMLLERTREEHGWRSRISSPLVTSSCISTDIVCLSSSPARNPELTQHEQATSPPSETAHELDSPSLVIEDAQAVMAAPLLVVEDAGAVMAAPLLVIEDAGAVMAAPLLVVEDAQAAMGAVMGAREERPSTTQRVSLLSLLNQDMEMDLEDGVRLEMLCGGCRLEEDGEEQETEEEAGEQAETRREELDPMCCVCMVGVKGAAFIPCGHTFCRKCCREVRRSLGSCPLCNQAIVDVLKLY